MGKVRAQRRAAIAVVPVLSSDNKTSTRHVAFELALRKIARREWRAIWFEGTGELAGVQLVPPDNRRTDRLIRIRCGSVECLKGLAVSTRARQAVQANASLLSLRLQLFNESGEKLRLVTANLALLKIALSQWKPVWAENGELIGVTPGC